MVKTPHRRALILAGLLLIPACTDSDAGNATTTADPNQDDDVIGVVEVQAAMTALATEIQASAASEQLRDAWAELETAINEALATFQSGDPIDAAALEQEMDDFENTLDSLSDDVVTIVRDGWDLLRENLEELIAA